MINVDIPEWFLWLFTTLMPGCKKGNVHLNKSADFNDRFV